jgi:hypothetical protein
MFLDSCKQTKQTKWQRLVLLQGKINAQKINMCVLSGWTDGSFCGCHVWEWECCQAGHPPHRHPIIVPLLLSQHAQKLKVKILPRGETQGSAFNLQDPDLHFNVDSNTVLDSDPDPDPYPDLTFKFYKFYDEDTVRWYLIKSGVKGIMTLVGKFRYRRKEILSIVISLAIHKGTRKVWTTICKHKQERMISYASNN